MITIDRLIHTPNTQAWVTFLQHPSLIMILNPNIFHNILTMMQSLNMKKRNQEGITLKRILKKRRKQKYNQISVFLNTLKKIIIIRQSRKVKYLHREQK